MEFQGFGKIPRLKSSMVVTEKLDGTNAQVYIVNNDTERSTGLWNPPLEPNLVAATDEFSLFVGSRKRWITPDDDNYGFARWVSDHGIELINFLGEGKHFGEWWGKGIQRRYDMDEKKFSLFNVNRFGKGRQELPDFLDVVPTLASGNLESGEIDQIMKDLKDGGSVAAPGFMNPEGIIVWNCKARQYFKSTFEHDKGKWSE